MDLVPGGARRNLTAKRAAALLSEVTPTGAPAVIRWQLAVDLVADVRQLEQRIAAVEARIKAAVAQSNTTLVQLFGAGPVLAATFLGEVGGIGRFPTKHHFAAHSGTTPLEASEALRTHDSPNPWSPQRLAQFRAAAVQATTRILRNTFPTADRTD
jgi:transposase